MQYLEQCADARMSGIELAVMVSVIAIPWPAACGVIGQALAARGSWVPAREHHHSGDSGVCRCRLAVAAILLYPRSMVRRDFSPNCNAVSTHTAVMAIMPLKLIGWAIARTLCAWRCVRARCGDCRE